MTCTFLPDDKITKNPKQKVLQQQARYYQYLFKSDINGESTHVNNGPKLTEGETSALENPITIRTLTKSVLKLPFG